MGKSKLGLFLSIFGILFLMLGFSSMFIYNVNILPFFIISLIGGLMVGMGLGLITI
jgi:hypothetical protein